jgi:DNA mismatch repair protein MutS2
VAELETARTALRQRLEEVTAAPAALPPPAAPPAGGWRPGMAVRVRHLGQTGRLLTVPGPDGVASVQVGILRVSAGADDLEPAPEPAPDPGPTSSAAARGPAAGMALATATALPAECDLRGLRVDEAVERLDRYLDDMALAGRTEARIIHGKGTGALRQAVSDRLRGHRLVAGYRLGVAGEGGDGVTVVTLRG